MVWVLLCLGALVALLLALAVVGTRLPRRHVAASAIEIARPPAEVWAAVADFAGWTAWAPGVKAMERLPDRGGREVWRFSSGHHRIATEVIERTPPRRLVTRIADDDLPFGGSWTWELADAPTGTLVTVTEDGEIRNALFRSLARFVFGRHGTQEKYLRSLAKRLGTDAAPQRIA